MPPAGPSPRPTQKQMNCRKTHVILSEVAVRHEVEGSVTCGAFHHAAFKATGKADSSTAQPAAAPLRMTQNFALSVPPAKNPPGPRRYLTARRFLGAVFARQKTHVILREVAVRHEVEGSVPCGAFHHAAFQAAGKTDSSTAQPAAAPLRMTQNFALFCASG